ncbi:MAG: ABC transporter ATP-binding protein [Holophaga sp.]|nr:ABC transporter ATP-binding protein [Holophaga sp.]
MELNRFGITVLFGASGCGKTTILRCLAGLDRPDTGAIFAEDVPWFDAASGRFVPPHRRHVGYVFQESALFPHLDVRGNIAFGLRDWSSQDRTHRVSELLRLMGLEGMEGRRPVELSGGEKQRVAMARALAPRPRLLLLDEPFASLDRPAAEQLRHELRHVLQAMKMPVILVTHNRDEALSLGDHLLLMREGCICQGGSPTEVFAKPDSREAAELLGFGTVVRTRIAGRTEGLLRLLAGEIELVAPDPGGEFNEAYACIRGEGVSLERHGSGAVTQRNRLAGRVTALHHLGPLVRVQMDCGFPLESLITSWACEDLALAVGEPVHALIKATAVIVIPIEG